MAPGSRLFSEVLVQVRRTNILLTEWQSDAIKSYCKFWGFQRTLSCCRCLKISVTGEIGFCLLPISVLRTDSVDLLRRHICTIWVWFLWIWDFICLLKDRAGFCLGEQPQEWSYSRYFICSITFWYVLLIIWYVLLKPINFMFHCCPRDQAQFFSCFFF